MDMQENEISMHGVCVDLSYGLALNCRAVVHVQEKWK
jgi:hypothetical protein